MSLPVALLLAALAGALLVLERRGVDTTLRLRFKGDVQREAAFLHQYGQSVATPLAGWLAAIARGNDWRVFLLVCGPVLLTTISCMVLKRCFGRVRPNREGAGRFTGFAWRHESRRESFPSSHSACAVALSVTLAHLWPQAALVFWLLAAVTALLRYVSDAHFPSDVLAGVVLGWVIGEQAFAWLDRWLPRAWPWT